MVLITCQSFKKDTLQIRKSKKNKQILQKLNFFESLFRQYLKQNFLLFFFVKEIIISKTL